MASSQTSGALLDVNNRYGLQDMYQPGKLPRSQAERRAVSTAFAEVDVAQCYAARAPYAPALFDFLLRQVDGRGRALDLGCGPGKIAVTLADHFDEVVALDPSAAMIEAGRAADAGRHGNIVWVLDTAEAYHGETAFDLVTAGSSIHWPDHGVLFPKLADWTQVVAIITGDEARRHPCGEDAWVAFLTEWIARMGGRYDPPRASTEAQRHEAWMDIAGRQSFEFTFHQPIEAFIEGQHSRATWARRAMGDGPAEEFDRALDTLMRPFATNGVLALEMVSELTWGAPRRTPRA
jgi:SAM-dependent methyltransferase